MSAEKKKIVLTQSQIKICKLFAAEGLDKDKAEAEAKGIPFDYEAEKAKREHEFIMFYAAEMVKDRDWEEERDKAFHKIIPTVIGWGKLYNYVRDHVPDLKAMRELDPADVFKTHGYGKKTAEGLREVQKRIRDYPKILTKLNKAIEQERRMAYLRAEHGALVSNYNMMKMETSRARIAVADAWRYYGG